MSATAGAGPAPSGADTKQPSSVNASPAVLARESLRLLAARRLAPTPDNYHRVYVEIAGPAAQGRFLTADAWLRRLLGELRIDSPMIAHLSRAIERAASQQDWHSTLTPLARLVEKGAEAQQDSALWADLIRGVMREFERRHRGWTPARKRDSLERVLGATQAGSSDLAARLQTLVRTWADAAPAEDLEVGPSVGPASGAPDTAGTSGEAGKAADERVALLREMLIQALEYGVLPQLESEAQLASDVRAAIEQTRAAADRGALAEVAGRLRRLWLRIEFLWTDQGAIEEGLLRLLRLLVDNVTELLADDQWLHGQIEIVRDIVSNPSSARMLEDAERALKEVIYRQGTLKHSLSEAKASFKDMVATFLDRLAAFSDTAGDYQGKLDGYSRKIRETDDVTQIGRLIDEVMLETRAVQLTTQRSRDEVDATRRRAEDAEQKIRRLEVELSQVSGMVREDQLTGILNRRGLDDAFQREAARADRRGSAMSVALLDVDNFKAINDTHGHQTGDEALRHLVKVIRRSLRPHDVIARYGGEEFLVLLPDTGLDDAIAVVTRLQRNLTKRFFLHNNEKLLITFSAGVALRQAEESQNEVTGRADKALYEAKEAGKNRVIAAP